MKKVALFVLAILVGLSSGDVAAAAKKSYTPKGGHYIAPGSSHKGGKYRNPKTGNHYHPRPSP